MTYSGRHLAYFLHLKPQSLGCMELLRWFWLSCKYMYIYFLEESIINLVPSPLRVLCACGWNDEFAKTCAMKFKWGDVSGPRHPWSISACHHCTILTLHSSLLLFTADAFQLGWGLIIATEVLWTVGSWWGIVNNDILTMYCEPQTPLVPACHHDIFAIHKVTTGPNALSARLLFAVVTKTVKICKTSHFPILTVGKTQLPMYSIVL